MIRASNFAGGILILGLNFTMVLLYGMSSPFLIEHQLQLPATVTGYCSLLSGKAILLGGSLSRLLIQKPFNKKLVIAGNLQLVTVTLMIPTTLLLRNLSTLVLFVGLMHQLVRFIFNNLISYYRMRFPQYAGKVNGLVGSGFLVVTSLLSSGLTCAITVTQQTRLRILYAV